MNYITKEKATQIAAQFAEDATYEFNIANAAIQHYLDQRKAELPMLPETNVPEGDWFVLDCYIKEYAQAYGAACAAHAREMALSEAAKACKQLETAIDGGGNTYYRPADARQCVSAIEALKGK